MGTPSVYVCPKCQQRTGTVYRVQTLPGRVDTVLLTLTCQSCKHEWDQEKFDPLVRPTLAEK